MPEMKCVSFVPEGSMCKFGKVLVYCFFTPEYERDCEDARFNEGPQTAEELYLKAQELKNHTSILNDSVR